MLLHKNKIMFKQVLKEVSDYVGLDEFQIEKDYYVSLVLKSLSSNSTLTDMVFKGGTSLSKCYNVIKRFSEDIDIAFKFQNKRLADSKRKKIKYAIIDVVENLEMVIENKEKIQSDRNFIQYYVNYDKHKQGEMTNQGLLPTILIESMYIYQPYPCEKLSVGSYITTYLSENGHQDIVKEYKLEPFKMLVQTIERTFIDKIFAICDYHLSGKYSRYSRHLYDIHMIWGSGKLDVDQLKKIIPSVIEDRKSSPINRSCQVDSRPLDILVEIINDNVFEEDYNKLTKLMIYDDVTYIECINTLKTIIDEDFIPEQIRELALVS